MAGMKVSAYRGYDKNLADGTMERKETIGFILVMIAAISWSTAGLFTRVVQTDIPTTLLWRSVFGGLIVMAIFAVTSNQSKIVDLFRFSMGEFVIAIVSALGMASFISEIFYSKIANVSLVYGAVPLVIGRVMFRSRLS
ncbi:EamA family transporter [Loktanella sp. S4079]|uniref:EamA family transporter n=1 Tax=Loktanella sp. S4079 TaxID=579483 RepID=UPI0006974710|nr:hypothetical protein [Loktanella sp. S4079]